MNNKFNNGQKKRYIYIYIYIRNAALKSELIEIEIALGIRHISLYRALGIGI